MRWRPQLVIYHYQIDPQFGWMHPRIQTWFPFFIHVCINGREWLARRMDEAGLRYTRQGNCFPWVEDCGRAQKLFDEQPRAPWEESLQPFALVDLTLSRDLGREGARTFLARHRTECA